MIGKHIEFNDEERSITLEKQLDELRQNSTILEKQVAQLKENPYNVINNDLQIVCIGKKNNYLDMLTKQWGFDLALEYIKDCALSSLTC